MGNTEEYFNVKQVSELLNTEPYVLRFYEKELGLNIRRNDKGHRLYTQIDVQMFKEILDLREQRLQLRAVENIIHDKYYGAGQEQEVVVASEVIQPESQQEQQVDIYEQLAALTKEVADLRRITEGRRPALTR